MSIAFLPAPDLAKSSFPTLKKKKLVGFVQTICFTEEHEAGDISFIFCSDKYLHSLNKKYLNHDTLTDIITFDYSNESVSGSGFRVQGQLAKPQTRNPEPETLSGDIFISIDRVTENAKKFKQPFTRELHRVIFHGVLHLCGYKDKNFKDAKMMRSKEEYYLGLWNK